MGCRGIPAGHGGFETFAERLALYLVECGWAVTVYCQSRDRNGVDIWNGIRRVHVKAPGEGPAATALFDLRATLLSLRRRELPLVLGYNTALFSVFYRLAKRRSVMNMDGIEWQRARWSRPVKAWFRFNEWLGCRLSDHLVADHPEIARHLTRHVPADRISTIAYGGEPIDFASADPLAQDGLKSNRYAILVARIVPENSILEIVEAWSALPVLLPLAIVGNVHETDSYSRTVIAAAGPNVRFLGGVYDQHRLRSLRYHARFHVHGHQVGGSNPSLIEALAAGSPVIAHDNLFNRWVAGPKARFFRDHHSLVRAAIGLAVAPQAEIAALRLASRRRFEEAFRWDAILSAYEAMLSQWVTS